MKNEKLGLEPAFPIFNEHGFPGDIKNVCYNGNLTIGMSKRYLTAKDILCAVLSNSETMKSFANEERFIDGISKEEIIVNGCYAWADILLKQENYKP